MHLKRFWSPSLEMFIAVKCVECSLFQTQQQRKDKKFICKVCGTKQSVKKVRSLKYTWST